MFYLFLIKKKILAFFTFWFVCFLTFLTFYTFVLFFTFCVLCNSCTFCTFCTFCFFCTLWTFVLFLVCFFSSGLVFVYSGLVRSGLVWFGLVWSWEISVGLGDHGESGGSLRKIKQPTKQTTNHPNIARLQNAAQSISHRVCFFFYQKTVLSFVRIWVFAFGHNFGFWVLSQFKFLSFVAIWVFEFCSFWVFTIWVLSFVTIWVFSFVTI